MPQYFAALTIVLMLGLVLTRARMLKRKGIEAFKFGKLDPKDFLIPPFAFFFFYLIFANAFGWPSPVTSLLFDPGVLQWIGVLLCLVGLIVLTWSLVSFGRSFRVGIDTENPDKLITDGIFAYTRNPIYVAFGFILIGQFVIFPNWILLIYLLTGFWLFNRQIKREEAYLKVHYGQEYEEYTRKVRRYL
jgi:protein-S-isoprenylcysteine O-methyltransferase Ste14